MRPEHHVLASELTAMICEGVRSKRSVSEGVPFWLSSGAREKALRFLTVNELAAREVRAGTVRSAVINDVTLVHAFWLLELPGADIIRYIELLRDPKIRAYFPLTKFWVVYVESIARFSGLPASADPPAWPKGYEKYWLPYLDFMAGRLSWEAFLAAAHESFAARNRQRRSIDWIGWDGDAEHPTHWDLRFESIKTRTPNQAAPNAADMPRA